MNFLSLKVNCRRP